MLLYGTSWAPTRGLLLTCAPPTTPGAPAEPSCTIRTRTQRIQMATVHRTGAQPAPCGRRSHRSHRIRREASSGPPLTPQTTSLAPQGGETCRPCRGSWRRACIWNLGCDLVGHLRDKGKVIVPVSQFSLVFKGFTVSPPSSAFEVNMLSKRWTRIAEIIHPLIFQVTKYLCRVSNLWLYLYWTGTAMVSDKCFLLLSQHERSSTNPSLPMCYLIWSKSMFLSLKLIFWSWEYGNCKWSIVKKMDVYSAFANWKVHWLIFETLKFCGRTSTHGFIMYSLLPSVLQ